MALIQFFDLEAKCDGSVDVAAMCPNLLYF